MKNMKKLTIVLMLVLAATSLAAQKKIRLKVATMAPARSPWDIELRKLAQEWRKITNGQVSVTFYPTASLGGEKAVIQKLKPSRPGQRAPLSGAIFTPVGLHELAPKAYVYTLTLPFLIQNQEELDLVLQTYGGGMERQIEKSGCKLIVWSNVGWLSFYTKESFSSFEELKRLRTSVGGLDSPVLSNSFRISGFNVQDIPAAKFNQSLKSKSGIQSFMSVPLATYVMGSYKDINYVLDAKLCPIVAGFVLTNEAWSSIPEKYKPAMMAAVNRLISRLNTSLKNSDNEYMAKIAAAGVKLITPSKTEIAQWRKDFDKAIDKIAREVPGAFDVTLYKNIQSLLEEKRAH